MYGRELKVFRCIFWAFMGIIVVLRAFIATARAHGVLHKDLDLRRYVNNLHLGYFTSIALVECVSAFFLLRKLASVRRSLRQAELRSGIFQYIVRSTEARVATLAVLGASRAATYCFQPRGQQASSTANQIDRFVYTLECMFPVMML